MSGEFLKIARELQAQEYTTVKELYLPQRCWPEILAVVEAAGNNIDSTEPLVLALEALDKKASEL